MSEDSRDFNIGIDLEDIERWQRLLPALNAEPDYNLFHAEEHEYCLSYADAASHYAGRWCAKEAVVKALAPALKLTTRDVKILSDESGAPYAQLVQAKESSRRLDVKVSITHSKTTAAAIALAVIPLSEAP
jgi:holo-[acyl-carrier protein] synthase